MHHAEIFVCTYVVRQYSYTPFFLQISMTRFLLRGRICKAQILYKKNKLNIWWNKIVNSDISNYTWVLKFEDWILKTKDYFRKEVIEKFSIQPNDYAYH
jgi:hypothetical protein